MRLFILPFLLLVTLFVSVPEAGAAEIRGKSVFEAVNEERQAHGLRPLVPSKALVDAAQAKADHMVKYRYFAHYRLGVGIRFFLNANRYPYLVAGENLAKGFTDTDPLLDAWLASPTHKANILDKDYRETGIGIAQDQGKLVVVQYFGRRK